MKILYVEDNDDNIYVLKNRLGRAGIHGAGRAATASRAWPWRAPSSPTSS